MNDDLRNTPVNPFAEVVHNPYASPTIPDAYTPGTAIGPPFQGLWRQGNVLVMYKLAPLKGVHADFLDRLELWQWQI